MDRGVEICLARVFIDAPDSNNETPRLWYDTHTSLVFIGPYVIPYTIPDARSFCIHERGEERWSPLVHTSPTSLVYIIYRTYTFACIHICGVLTIPGPENLQGSIALPPDCARTSLTDAATEEGTLFLFSSLAGFSLRTAPSGIIGEYCFEKYASRLVFYKSRFVSEMRAWEINVTISSSYLCRPMSVPRAITPSNNEGKSFSKKFVSSVPPRAFLPFVLIINRCFGARVSVSRNIKESGEKKVETLNAPRVKRFRVCCSLWLGISETRSGEEREREVEVKIQNLRS